MTGSASNLARAFWVGVLLVAAFAVSLVVRGALSTGEAEPSRAIAPCQELDLSDLGRRVTCRTATRTLTLAAEGFPVVVGGTEGRVLGSSLRGRTLTVRLRLRNRDGTTGRSPLRRRQVYVRVGEGARVFSEPVLGGAAEPGETRTIRARFRLPRSAARELRRDAARADLAIVPQGELERDEPRRLGVVRLDPR